MFPRPQVKKLLTSGFVEARIHTDLTPAHPTYGFNARIQEVRAQFLGKGNVAVPQYIVVDPADPFRAIVKLEGAASADKFVRFFKEAIEKSQ